MKIDIPHLTLVEKMNAMQRAIRLVDRTEDGSVLPTVEELHNAIAMIYFYDEWRDLLYKLRKLLEGSDK